MAAVGGALVSLRACTSAASVSSAVKVGIIYLIKRGIGWVCVCIINQPINNNNNNNNTATKVMKKQLPTSLGVSNYLGNSTQQQQQISSNDYHLSSLGPRANRIIPLSIFITVNRCTSIAISFAWETLCMKRKKSQISCEDQLNYFFFLLFAFCFFFLFF